MAILYWERSDTVNILKLSKIIENFIDKHKSIHEIGRGMWMDKNPERDIDVRYKGKDYLLTISKI